jgi:tRNA-specific 2-thiouridylase
MGTAEHEALGTMPSRPRVVVAMSGGVDSSVAAALLLERGYDVTGMMMRLWAEDCGEGSANRCCTPGQMADARRIAAQLGIPFYIIDTQEVFRRTIVQFFMDRYAAGDTPNPCLECNRLIRFEWLLGHALASGADYLATGHYARVEHASDGHSRLLKARDPAKDQSYVLSVLTQDKLRHALFPVGDYAKAEIRAMAAARGLPVAAKRDSQDLCFLADGDYRRFMRQHAPGAAGPGPILTRDGRQLGTHSGLLDYTIGQRKGLGVSHREPLYVLATDPARNALIVGPLGELGRASLSAGRVNWIAGEPPASRFAAEIRIRYQARLAPGTVTVLSAGRVQVDFDAPQRGITPGQGVVFYTGEECLGGGIIARDQE